MLNKIYDILVKEGGAIEDNREMFLDYFRSHTTDYKEFRFCGFLGFGGKLFLNCGQLYVDYYMEDKNLKREKIRNKINQMIEELLEQKEMK